MKRIEFSNPYAWIESFWERVEARHMISSEDDNEGRKLGYIDHTKSEWCLVPSVYISQYGQFPQPPDMDRFIEAFKLLLNPKDRLTYFRRGME